MFSNEVKKIQHPKIKNFLLEIQARYYNYNQMPKKEWFTNNIPESCYSSLKSMNNNLKKELIVKFTHIDEDNPEFFLQPKQIIKVLEYEILINNEEKQKPLILIHEFRHVNEVESNQFRKNNNIL
ncbi:hypothetical protein [Candidatus Phytoplasma prunorum]|uniref:hypothetical protein n=1 Tax=Candidatus Phytoplasma prunorum TaxID=47565 RepID=UPI002FF06595